MVYSQLVSKANLTLALTVTLTSSLPLRIIRNRHFLLHVKLDVCGVLSCLSNLLLERRLNFRQSHMLLMSSMLLKCFLTYNLLQKHSNRFVFKILTALVLLNIGTCDSAIHGEVKS